MALNRPSLVLPLLALLGGLPASAALSYTCDPNIDATQAGTCAYLNSTIAGLYNNTFSNISANIYVQYGNTGLGMSNYYLNFVSWDQYVSAISNVAQSTGNAIQTSAVSALNSLAQPLYGSYMVNISSAQGKAFQITGMVGSDASGNPCFTPGSGACYDGTITVSNSVPLYYRQGTQAFDSYDFYATVEHETDEVLGTSSCIDTTGASLANACGADVVAAVDLYRYQSAGNLVLISTARGAYFSYNGGQTNGAGTYQKVYNTLANGDDYADFVSSNPCQLQQSIQDGVGCPGFDGGLDITNDGGAEINILTALGFTAGAATVTPTPSGLEVSDIAPPPAGCTFPAAMTSFTTSNGTVYLYFNATVTTSDNITSDWLSPNHVVYTGGAWSGNSGTLCFVGTGLTITNLPANQLGSWLARIYDNGQEIGSISFSVSTASRPVISSLSPSSAVAGSGGFTLTVNGSGFASGATVLWNGTPLATSFISATELTATVTSNLIAFTGIAAITVSSGNQTSGTDTFTISTAATNLSRIGVLPQMAAGAGWDTEMYVTNTTGSAVSVELLFYADNGSVLSLPLTVTQQGVTLNTNTATLTATIAPNTTLAVDTGTLSGLAQGWVDVRSNGVLTAFAVFRYAPAGLSGKPGITTPWEGTVPLQTQLSPTTLIVPFDNTNGFADGVALGNLSGSGANFTASFYDLNGNPLGSPQNIFLAANGHTAFVVNTQYAFTANTTGIMRITGPALMGLGLRASPYGTLTAVPVPLQ